MSTHFPKMPSGEEYNPAYFNKRRRALRNEFSSYIDPYHSISRNFRPRRGLHLKGGGQNGPIDGSIKHQDVINTTPLRVAKNAQSGLQAGVTSPSRPWKKLGPSKLDLLEVPGARDFFDELDKTMDFVFAKSNFYRATHTAYADFVDYGPAAVQIDQHDDDIIRCQVHPIGSWVGASNADGRVDVFYRDYRPTGYEVISKFGREILEPELLRKIDLNPYTRLELRNAIEPNPFFAGGDGPVLGLAAFPYISVWWVKGHDRDFLKVHGYYEFPVLVFRFAKSENGDAYGYGAGSDGIGDAKQLQHMERKKLRAIDKMVEPPLQAPTSLKQRGVSLVPGKVTYHDGPAKVESLYDIQLPIHHVLEDIRQVERRLAETFFEDLFLMISQSVTRQVTAREIEERHEEKLIMLGPVLESINDEFLDPAIDRTLGIMRRAGLFPAAPPELEGVDFKVEYISILAQAQRAIQTIAIEQGVSFIGATAEVVPEIRDRLDADGTADEYFARIGFPPKGVRSIKDANVIRAQRAQAEQRAQQLEMAGEAASAVKDGASAMKDSGIQPSVLQQLLGV